MTLNKMMIIGNLGADPELRYTPSGKAVTNLRVAVNDLEVLLSVLFPDPPALDCITIDDILRRYRLTGSRAAA